MQFDLQAKVCAGAVAAQVLGVPTPYNPINANKCDSFVSHAEVIHVAAVYRYDKDKKSWCQHPARGSVACAHHSRGHLCHGLGDLHHERHHGLNRQ